MCLSCPQALRDIFHTSMAGRSLFVLKVLLNTNKSTSQYYKLSISVSDLCVSGVAGSVATVLHDAIMTPADGMLLSLSLHLNGHFPGEPGLASVYYWSYKSCKASVKSSPPTNQHPVILQTGCPSCHPTNSVKALKGKYHIPWTCLPQTHLGSSNFVSDH